ALAWRRGAWGGALVEPEVLLRLARRPPADAGALADVPGVGAALAERVGGTIMEALGVSSNGCVAEPSSPALAALEAWRRQVAYGMGVPPYAVLRDSVLRAIAVTDLPTRESLARIPGLGPRAYAKFADDILRIIALPRLGGDPRGPSSVPDAWPRCSGSPGPMPCGTRGLPSSPPSLYQGG
ncbi:MAG: HRDC domain-containing protein, partial [Gemmatimonadales bacterium]|nr:HRDC domain-containing protein [Gemmatimonadales bacterium]